MTIAYWCVLAFGLSPYFFATLAKSSKGFNNNTPREFLQQATGWRKRAHWVQLNNFETFPLFATCTLIAHQFHYSQEVSHIS